jgi:hypothetical protein
LGFVALDLADPAFFAALIGILTGVASLFYTRSMVEAARRTAEETEKKRREDTAMQIINTFRSPEFAHILRILRDAPVATADTPRTEIPLEIQEANIYMTQQFETLGILVEEGLVDLNLLEKCLGTFVTDSWHRQRPIIERLRAEFHDPLLAEYYQWLAELMHRLAQQHPKAPAYVRLANWTPA